MPAPASSESQPVAAHRAETNPSAARALSVRPQLAGNDEVNALCVVVLAPLGRDAQLLADAVRENGAACRICGDLDQLIAVLRSGEADLLLLTYASVGFDGHLRLLDALEACPRDDLVPVVLLARSTDLPQPLVRRAGVLVISMPTRKRLLTSAIRSALETRERVLLLRARGRELTEKHAQLERMAVDLQNQNLELAQAIRTQNRFIASTSHELRTPLNALIGYLDLLDFDPLTERQQGYIVRIRFSTNHVLDLIQEILDVAKAKAGGLRVEQELLELMPIVEKAAALIVPQAEGKGLRLDIDRPSQPLPLVRGNAQRISQVLLNLLSNAVKFTHAGGISVRLEQRDQGVIAVLVQDSGIGIAQNDLQKLFTEFYRVDDSFASRQGGAGLGLAISKQLAVLMGGDLSVTSRLGEGSTFVLTLATRL